MNRLLNSTAAMIFIAFIPLISNAQLNLEQVTPIPPDNTAVPKLEMADYHTRIVDMNGDGHLDVVSWEVEISIIGFGGWEFSMARPQVNINDGMGNLNPIQNELFDNVKYYDFSLGDLDGDGDIDLLATEGVLATNSLYGLHYFLNDGTGHFDVGNELSFGFLEPDIEYRTLLTDKNGDGLDDLIVLMDDNVLFSFTNMGNADFQIAQTFPYFWMETDLDKKMFLVDLNNDGLDEVVTNHHILEANGSDYYEFTQFFSFTSEGFIATGDLDQNGWNDLISYIGEVDPLDEFHYEIQIYYSSEYGLSSYPVTIFQGETWDGYPAGVPVGVYDIDQNEHDDILLYTEPEENYYVNILYNNGDGTFTYDD